MRSGARGHVASLLRRPGWLRGVLLVPAVLLALSSCTATPSPSPSPTHLESLSTARFRYATEKFSVPFTAAVDQKFLLQDPITDSPNLVYWAGLSGEKKMRFLIPASIWVPGTDVPSDPPTDYLAYLHDQAKHGIRLSNQASTTVDGHPATLVTVSSDTAKEGGYYDGSTGCIRPDGQSTGENECFGFQQNFQFRLAIVPLGKKTLLAWARPNDNAHSAGAPFIQAFEAMLHSIHFR